MAKSLMFWFDIKSFAIQFIDVRRAMRAFGKAIESSSLFQ